MSVTNDSFFVYDWIVRDPLDRTAPTYDDDDDSEHESDCDCDGSEDDTTAAGGGRTRGEFLMMAYAIRAGEGGDRGGEGGEGSGEGGIIYRLEVTGFRPHLYMTLPDWVDGAYLERHQAKIQERVIRLIGVHNRHDCGQRERQRWKGQAEEDCSRCWRGDFHLVKRGRLYYGQTQAVRAPHAERLWWYIRLRFPTEMERKWARARIVKSDGLKLPAHNPNREDMLWKSDVHEGEASPVLQMTTQRHLPSVGWVRLRRGRALPVSPRSTPANRMIRCRCEDLEWDRGREDVPGPRVLSFDLEVYSADKNRMPDAEKASDEIFEIGVSIASRGRPTTKILLQQCPPGAEESFRRSWDATKGNLVLCRDEKELLLRFREVWLRANPHVATGYNIFGFDFPYLLRRCEMHGIQRRFLRLGSFRDPTRVREISWSSSAYRNQHFRFPQTEGVVCVDLLPLVRRDFKLSNYKLKTVSTFFLGDTKDPLTPQDLFRAYEALRDHSRVEPMIEAGVYCLQDADLVMRLFEHLQTWVGLCEMARISQVSLWSLYVQGQQIKVYSQIYRLCQTKKYVINPPRAPEVLPYTGATVFPPEPGIYAWVVPFDFASLYPTTIIAYNIDYSTFIPEERVKAYDASAYHTIEWDEHTACEHDTEVYTAATRPLHSFCGKRRYCFLKAPLGVLPELLQSLLGARKETRRQLAALEVSQKGMREVLDKRQLAYKVSANSMYGAMGVTKGYLPFMPGAMCTTAMGRQNIEKAAAYVQSVYGARLIYGDTDSIYVHFPSITTAPALWEHACRVEKDLLSLFPSPMKLAFEEKLYKQFLILTKKRYMALTCDEHGTIDHKLTIRGVLLARRDNCLWARQLYETIVRNIMASASIREIEDRLSDEMARLFQRQIPLSSFIITKLVGSDYVITPPPLDEKKRKKRLLDLGLHDLSSSTISSTCLCGKEVCRVTRAGSGQGTTTMPPETAIMTLIPLIEGIFREWFGGDPVSLATSDPLVPMREARLQTPEYLRTLREGTVAELFSILGEEFYPSRHSTGRYPCPPIAGILDHLVGAVRGRDPPAAGPVADKKTTFHGRGWDAVMISLLREAVRYYLRLDTAHEIKLSLPMTMEQTEKYLFKEQWNARTRSSRHCEGCACFVCLYNRRSQPAHVQLAHKMRRRGLIVESGSRLEYIVIRHPDDPKARLFDKLEDPGQYRRFPGLYTIDPFYYLHLLAFPMDQLLGTCFRRGAMFTAHIDLHLHKKKCMEELISMHRPRYVVLDSVFPYNERERWDPSQIATRRGVRHPK